MSEPIRLQKLLSECGVASRRAAEKLIEAGRVQVNGQTAKVGDKADAEKDRVTLDGKPIRRRAEPICIMLHKPRGYITTMHDEKNRKCVAELVKDLPMRVYPVGRLDRESEGLLLMTNDGEFANAMMHPSHHVPKTYRVTVKPGITEEQLNRMAEGIVIDGRKTAPAEVRVLEEEKDRAVLQIVLHEGRNREIRKMCEALNLETARLKRIAFGPIRLGMLPPGKWRELTGEEVAALRALAGLKAPAEGGGKRSGGKFRRNGQAKSRR
ncbi:pseudouridine synthase [Thermocaproicibacter melissae]|uniref:pseudouridine synthase n=1 Tax=Thermocaproicibacter melissae TaxID=2966552 RepID=UPI0024B14205|nr:pseudouridine synthase [Thermocaproicibacter melissae]WBY64641.1 pseudouridine synthase [Thermocaproicibacter melissae]